VFGNVDTFGATTPNSAPRQFTFNGAAVAVPEAGTLALLLPALALPLVQALRRVSVGASRWGIAVAR